MRARVEVVRQESDAHAHRDDGDERSDVRGIDHVAVDQFLAVEEERSCADRHDAGRQPVEPVDQVDRLRHPQEPQHGHQRAPFLREQDRTVEEGQPERVHDHAELDQREACEHGAGDLCRGRQAAHVVDEPDDVDDRRCDKHADRLGVAREQHIECVEQPGGEHGREQADVHRHPTDIRQRTLVHRPIVRQVHPAPTSRDHAHEGRGAEGDERRDGSDQEKGTGVGHDRSAYDGINWPDRPGTERRARRRPCGPVRARRRHRVDAVLGR